MGVMEMSPEQSHASSRTDYNDYNTCEEVACAVFGNRVQIILCKSLLDIKPGFRSDTAH